MDEETPCQNSLVLSDWQRVAQLTPPVPHRVVASVRLFAHSCRRGRSAPHDGLVLTAYLAHAARQQPHSPSVLRGVAEGAP